MKTKRILKEISLYSIALIMLYALYFVMCWLYSKHIWIFCFVVFILSFIGLVVTIVAMNQPDIYNYEELESETWLNTGTKDTPKWEKMNDVNFIDTL
jgi:predicted tellurium resistance membrane protein TerC